MERIIQHTEPTVIKLVETLALTDENRDLTEVEVAGITAIMERNIDAGMNAISRQNGEMTEFAPLTDSIMEKIAPDSWYALIFHYVSGVLEQSVVDQDRNEPGVQHQRMMNYMLISAVNQYMEANPEIAAKLNGQSFSKTTITDIIYGTDSYDVAVVALSIQDILQNHLQAKTAPVPAPVAAQTEEASEK